MIRKVKQIAGTLLVLTAMSGCLAVAAPSGIVQNIDDPTITTFVKTQLAADKSNTLTHVGVETKNGIVYLTGEVETDGEKSRAATIASKVQGVKQVVNNLQVKR